MATEEKRILKMFYFMSGCGGYLKAGELAQKLELSERTVKGDMEQLKDFAKTCGCTLESIRGRGYTLKVHDAARFKQSREQMEILFSNIDRGHKENPCYQIARAIMRRESADADGYFRLEDLAGRLYISASAAKKEMPAVREFLSSFGLSLVSRPGRGLCLTGDEFGQRLCLLELCENHFRKRVVTFCDNAYAQVFADRGDKDAIRKVTLDTLRASDNEVFDIYVNRLVDYLLLMRNRVADGLFIHLDEEPWASWRGELECFREYSLAVTLLKKLEAFEEFPRLDGEAAAVALLLLLWSDWDGVPDLNVRFPALYPQARHLALTLIAQLELQWNISLKSIDPAFPDRLVPDLLRILTGMKFGYSQCRLIGNSVSANAIKSAPLCMALADYLTELLHAQCEKEINEYSVQLLAVRFYGLIERIAYSYVPRRILVCARNGKDSAQIIADGIQRRLGDWWIGKLTVSELYEARKFPPEEYDCLIGSFRAYAYRYSWPYIEVHPILEPQDYDCVRKEILLKGYDLERAAQLCNWDVVRIHRDFSGGNLQSILQLIAYQWGMDLSAKEQMTGFLSNERYMRVQKQVLTALVPASCTGKQIFELYILKKPVSCGEHSVRAILFASLDFRQEPEVLRYLEHAVRCLIDSFETLSPVLTPDNLMSTLTSLIRDKL